MAASPVDPKQLAVGLLDRGAALWPLLGRLSWSRRWKRAPWMRLRHDASRGYRTTSSGTQQARLCGA